MDLLERVVAKGMAADEDRLTAEVDARPKTETFFVCWEIRGSTGSTTMTVPRVSYCTARLFDSREGGGWGYSPDTTKFWRVKIEDGQAVGKPVTNAPGDHAFVLWAESSLEESRARGFI